jgi:hypothetical protein
MSTLSFTQTSSASSEYFPSGSLDGIDWETTKMFRDLQHLSGQLAAKDSGTFVGDQAELIDSICTAEKHIDSLVHERIERIDPSEHNPEFAPLILEYGNPIPVRACALSATIYVYLFLRRIPILSPVFDCMVEQVREDFGRTETIVHQLYPPELLFWLLFVAGSASLRRHERSWFRGKLARYRDILKLRRWNAARKLLEKQAWLETPGEFLGRALWEEMVS